MILLVTSSWRHQKIVGCNLPHVHDFTTYRIRIIRRRTCFVLANSISYFNIVTYCVFFNGGCDQWGIRRKREFPTNLTHLRKKKTFSVFLKNSFHQRRPRTNHKAYEWIQVFAISCDYVLGYVRTSVVFFY